jgi:hypothetical protein
MRYLWLRNQAQKMKDTAIKLFEDRKVRSAWDADAEKWYISIVDVIEVLTESQNPRHYWTVLKGRLAAEGNQTLTICDRLKMQAPDGKMRLTDVADVEQLFRLIQSIPLAQSRAVQNVAGAVGVRAARRDRRSRAGYGAADID